MTPYNNDAVYLDKRIIGLLLPVTLSNARRKPSTATFYLLFVKHPKPFMGPCEISLRFPLTKWSFLLGRTLLMSLGDCSSSHHAVKNGVLIHTLPFATRGKAEYLFSRSPPLSSRPVPNEGHGTFKIHVPLLFCHFGPCQ